MSASVQAGAQSWREATDTQLELSGPLPSALSLGIEAAFLSGGHTLLCEPTAGFCLFALVLTRAREGVGSLLPPLQSSFSELLRTSKNYMQILCIEYLGVMNSLCCSFPWRGGAESSPRFIPQGQWNRQIPISSHGDPCGRQGKGQVA